VAKLAPVIGAVEKRHTGLEGQWVLTAKLVLFQKYSPVTAAWHKLQTGLMFLEQVITLPGRSEERLAAVTPCRLQLCPILRSSATSYLVTTMCA
jgi:hypothetical protein